MAGGETTVQSLKRYSWLPDRDADRNGDLIAGQDYDDVFIAGGTIQNVDLINVTFTFENPVPVVDGGTGANNASDARNNLGLTIGSNVQAWSSILDNTTASFTTAYETKLNGIESGAEVNPTQEEIQDDAWNVLTGTQTGITVTYQDGTNDVDFLVNGLTTNEFASPNVSQWTNDAGYLTNVADNSVTNAKLADMAQTTIKGRQTGSTGDPEDLTPAQARAVMDVDSSSEVDAKITAAEADPRQLAKAWISFNGTGTISIKDSYNVSSITDNGTGNYTVTFDTDFANTNYVMSGACGGAPNAGNLVTYGITPTKTVGSCNIITVTSSNNVLTDMSEVNVVFFGDQ